MPQVKKDTGRPRLPFDQEMADEICLRVSQGESVRTILFDEHLISAPTFYKWIREEEDFAKQYATACADRADTIFDEMFEIADDGTNDWMEKELKDGSIVEVLNHEHVQRSKLRIDTRKWALARMAPKKYGEKLDLNHGGNLTVNLPEHVKEL